VPGWSYGGPIYITSKRTIDNVGKHYADQSYQIYQDAPEVHKKKKIYSIP